MLDRTRIALQLAARDAITCQNACNFSGVEHSFHRASDAVRERMHVSNTFSSEGFATHPIVYLFMSKLISLMGDYFGGGTNHYSKALRDCEAIASGDFSSVE